MHESEYHPLLDTLRLYAGWLLACLVSLEALSAYQHYRRLPFHVDILQEWGQSPLVLHVTLLSFLFLLLSSIHGTIERGFWKGALLGTIGIAIFLLFVINT